MLETTELSAAQETRYSSAFEEFLDRPKYDGPIILHVRFQQPGEPTRGIPPLSEEFHDEIRDTFGEAKWIHPIRDDLDQEPVSSVVFYPFAFCVPERRNSLDDIKEDAVDLSIRIL